MLASEIVKLAENEHYRLALSHGAVPQGRTFSWSKIVAALYTEISCHANEDHPARRNACSGLM